jgi:hypothetical protein
MLTPAQLATLKTDITANSASYPGAIDQRDGQTIAAFYNEQASPAFYVWRTDVTRAEVYSTSPQPENSSWNWTLYKAQSVTEQNAWTQMFMGDQANFALPNLRAGVSIIFTGSAQQNAQAAHVLAVGRRTATRAEKLLASGTGSTATPATMGFEGSLSGADILAAMDS